MTTSILYIGIVVVAGGVFITPNAWYKHHITWKGKDE